MPLFDFVCDTCKHAWEDMHRSGEPIPACPSCGSTQTEKLLTIGSAYVPIQLKPGTYDLPRFKKERKKTYNF
ncbi:MAG: zinc ribbon domain-containing protein [Myxococcales bacterium]|nr:zinc ribbon domain-containing protein [Myxococcales bacterium]